MRLTLSLVVDAQQTESSHLVLPACGVSQCQVLNWVVEAKNIVRVLAKSLAMALIVSSELSG